MTIAVRHCRKRGKRMRLIDADFEINHYLSMITNPTPDVTMYDKQHALAIVDALKMAKTVDTERKKWTTEEVAEILFNAVGDDCACNFNGIDEWLPERCKYTYIEGQCPNPKEKHGCWMQFIIQGGADMREGDSE